MALSEDSHTQWQEVMSFLLQLNVEENVLRLRDAVTTFLAELLEQPLDAPANLFPESAFVKLKVLIAANPATPASVLAYLAGNGCALVQARVAENCSTEPEVLASLCASPHDDVRWSCAQNMRAPHTALELLSRDQSPDVRFVLAENPLLPAELLSRLASDENPFVAARAAETMARQSGGEYSPHKFDLTPPSEIVAGTNDPQANLLVPALLAKLSHQLRSEVGAMMGMNELLLKTELNDEQRALASSVQQSSESLLALLNDFVRVRELSPALPGAETTAFNLIFLVQETTRLFMEVAQTRNLMLTTQIDQRIPEFLTGQPQKVREVLSCLISNSITNTLAGRVSVEALIESMEERSATIRFVVSDTGCGVTSKEAAILNRRNSTGELARVVLALSQQTIQSLGGTVNFKADNTGSEVSFLLRFQRPEAAARSKVTDNAFSGKRVLVVEDQANLRELFLKQLQTLAIGADVARNGHEAIAMLTVSSYDLILMDCYLPELDGFQTATMIRKMERGGPHVPIIAVTAGAMSEDKIRCEEAGMDDYLTKPLSLELLRQKVHQWLSLRARVQ